jgi:prepilin-type N-terminal cleavage/methylation domain-containing protein
MRSRIWGSRLRRVHGGQRGFSVIEMLIAVSVLGFVAAIVTSGVVSAAWSGRRSAAAQELGAVQRAFHAAHPAPGEDGCRGAVAAPPGTNDMRRLAGDASPLYPTYFPRAATTYHYYCEDPGRIVQADHP